MFLCVWLCCLFTGPSLDTSFRGLFGSTCSLHFKVLSDAIKYLKAFDGLAWFRVSDCVVCFAGNFCHVNLLLHAACFGSTYKWFSTFYIQHTRLFKVCHMLFILWAIYAGKIRLVVQSLSLHTRTLQFVHSWAFFWVCALFFFSLAK